MDVKTKAEEMTAKNMELIERERVRKGVSMRALSTAAGLRSTSYWGIVNTEGGIKSVRATTLFALNEAIRSFPER